MDQSVLAQKCIFETWISTDLWQMQQFLPKNHRQKKCIQIGRSPVGKYIAFFFLFFKQGLIIQK